MAKAMDEWELTKENIQPIQQGRKPGILKTALSVHADDKLLQQQLSFEQELRTYTGDDPLSVWFNYIKWVEQNFPKGGREGNIGKLIQHCLSILKDVEKYHDDERFVNIWLKFANMSAKPTEVYNNMYSHNIGCQTARFYAAWAWELEQLGDMKRADEVLIEGIQRNAHPVEILKSAHSQFEVRMTKKISEDSEKAQFEKDESLQRSAFALLKPQNKHTAPVSRVGSSMLEGGRQNMTLGGKQPQPRNAVSTKLPFKIYSAENEESSLPSSSFQSAPHFLLHKDSAKENEKKPSKWSKVRVQQNVGSVSESTKKPTGPDFLFHCDETPQQGSARILLKGSHVLSARKHPITPIALFEPPDPTKRPMYNKMKVYGGAKEFSFEEIRAAIWFENQDKLEKQKIRIKEEKEKEEFKLQLKMLQEKIIDLESRALPSAKLEKFEHQTKSEISIDESTKVSKIMHPSSLMLHAPICTANIDMKLESPPLKFDASGSGEQENRVTYRNNLNQKLMSGQNLINQKLSHLSIPDENSSSNHVPDDIFQFEIPPSNTFNEVANMVQELYNGTLTNPSRDDIPSFDVSNSGIGGKTENYQCTAFDSIKSGPQAIFPGSIPTVESGSILQPASSCQNTKSPSSENEVDIEPSNVAPAFNFYYDPTDVIPPQISVSPFSIFHDAQQSKENIKQIPTNESESVLQPASSCQNTKSPSSENQVDIEPLNKAPAFNIYYDPTDVVPPQLSVSPFPIFHDAQQSKENIKPILLSGKEDKLIPFVDEPDAEDVENMPPPDYVQEHTKREVSGILQPSKNVLYIPLEDEEQSDEDCLAEILPIEENVTLVTPLNAEQFAAAAHFASTPCVKIPHDVGRCDRTDSNPSAESIPPSDNAFKSPDCSKMQSISKPRDFNQTNQCSILRSGQLSTIMETSRELSNKSSSSSGSSMASITKLGSSHYSSHYSGSVKRLVSKASLPEHLFSEVSTKSLPIPFNVENCGTSNNLLKTKTTQGITEDKNNVIDMPVVQYCTDIDPFDQNLTNNLLKQLDVPVDQRKKFYSYKDSVENIKVGMDIKLGDVKCLVESLHAEGSYAKIFVAQYMQEAFDFNLSLTRAQRIVLKVCKQANEWEFYICSELEHRLSKVITPPDIKNSVMTISAAVAFQNSIVLISNFSEYGTLLDLVNVYKKQATSIPECLVMYLTLEMLQIISKLHDCGIVHGDVKPDNFLVKNIPTVDVFDCLLEKTNCLCLIDFGRSIDLTLFKPGISFKQTVKTDCFRCVEMIENRPWVFQTDWFGILGCIHVLLFSEYMSVQKNKYGKWEPVCKFKRYWQTDLWQPLFSDLLNISSCYDIPDLKSYIQAIATKLRQQGSHFKLQTAQLSRYLRK